MVPLGKTRSMRANSVQFRLTLVRSGVRFPPALFMKIILKKRLGELLVIGRENVILSLDHHGIYRWSHTLEREGINRMRIAGIQIEDSKIKEEKI